MQLCFVLPISFVTVIELLCKVNGDRFYGNPSTDHILNNKVEASNLSPYASLDTKSDAHGKEAQRFRFSDPPLSGQDSRSDDAGARENWGYSERNGPSHWPQSCHDGLRQSPVDFRARDIDYALISELKFVNYDHSGAVNVRNTGHGVQLDGFDRWRSQNRPYIFGGNLSGKYVLSQLHFHWSYDHDDGSEHTVNSLHYPVEMHFVHNKDGYTPTEVTSKPDGLAVVSVFMTHSQDGTSWATLDSALRQVTYNANNTQIFSYSVGVNLPENTQNFYRYMGSLTTPGCNEVVVWTVLAEPVGITTAQLKVLRSIKIGQSQILPDSNARPTRPLNGRRILYRSSTLNRDKLCSANALENNKTSSGVADFVYSYFKTRVTSGCSQLTALNSFVVFLFTYLATLFMARKM